MQLQQAIVLEKLTAFLAQSPLPTAVKDTFFTPECLTRDQNLFLGLTTVLASAFPELDAQQKVLLNAATYLAAKGVYQLDSVLDQQVHGQQRIEQAYHGHLFWLESQRLLGQLFPLQDAFWSCYYKRVDRHYQELSLSKNLATPLTDAAYTDLLAHKYALLFCPVDALYFLTGQQHQATYQTLLVSLAYFCKGYNLPNEVMGFSEDMSLEINNYAYWRLRTHVEPLGIDVATFSYEELHRIFYVSGLAATLLDEAVAALEQAAEVARPLNLAAYQHFLAQRIEALKPYKNLILQACVELTEVN